MAAPDLLGEEEQKSFTPVPASWAAQTSSASPELAALSILIPP